MKITMLAALALSSMCLIGTMDAQGSRTNRNANGKVGPNRPGGENSAPELDATSIGAGLVLLLGGTMIVLGRRRKALA